MIVLMGRYLHGPLMRRPGHKNHSWIHIEKFVARQTLRKSPAVQKAVTSRQQWTSCSAKIEHHHGCQKAETPLNYVNYDCKHLHYSLHYLLSKPPLTAALCGTLTGTHASDVPEFVSLCGFVDKRLKIHSKLNPSCSHSSADRRLLFPKSSQLPIALIAVRLLPHPKAKESLPV